MEKYRLFIASFAIMENYPLLQNELEKIFEGNFVKRKNLHMTFKFLGDTQDPQEIIDRLKDLKYRRKQHITFQKLKMFRKKFVVLRSSNKTLYKVHDKIDTLLGGAFQPNPNFKPHITLMKIKNIVSKNYKEELKQLHFQADLVLKVVLVQSILEDGKVKYKILKEF